MLRPRSRSGSTPSSSAQGSFTLEHGAGAIDGHHAFLHAGKHGLVLALLPQDALDAFVQLGRHRVQRFRQHADFLR